MRLHQRIASAAVDDRRPTELNRLAIAAALPRRRANAGLLRPPKSSLSPRRVSPNAAFVTQMLVPIIAFIGTDMRPVRGTVVAGNSTYRQG